MTRRALPVLRPAVLLLAGAVLVGCSSAPATPAPEGTGGADAGAVHQPVAIPDGIVARGELLLPDGGVFGEATIEWSGDAMTVHVPELAGLRSGGTSIMPALADGEVTIDQCAEPNVYALAIGDIPQPAPLELPEAMGDPSYFRYLLIVEQGVTLDGCGQPIRALAALEWDVPVVRPWIEVADAGADEGAMGAVLVEEGRPVLYRTAAGDSWDAIAARFGLAPDDLSYLNPIRLGNSTPGVAYADQVLNLDPDDRGDSETRRPGAPLTAPDAF